MKVEGFWARRGESHLITSARRSAHDNRRKRETIYLIIQVARLISMGLMFVSFAVWHNWWLTILFLVLTVPAPGIAVVIANEKGEKRNTRQPQVYKPALARRELRDMHEMPVQLEHRPADIIDHEE